MAYQSTNKNYRFNDIFVQRMYGQGKKKKYGMIIGNRSRGFVALIFIGTLMLCTYLYGIFYHETEMDMMKAPTEIQISSKNLVSSFLANENLANTRYVEKTIEVHGVVMDITFLNDRYTVFLQGGDEFCLMCDMQADQIEKVKRIRPGQEVLMKGICKGFLMDAILLNCVLLNKSQ